MEKSQVSSASLHARLLMQVLEAGAPLASAQGPLDLNHHQKLNTGTMPSGKSGRERGPECWGAGALLASAQGLLDLNQHQKLNPGTMLSGKRGWERESSVLEAGMPLTSTECAKKAVHQWRQFRIKITINWVRNSAGVVFLFYTYFHSNNCSLFPLKNNMISQSTSCLYLCRKARLS